MTHVIIADSSDVIRELLGHVVARTLGWESEAAATGYQAWELVRRYPPDLDIADGCMQDLTGLDLAQRMRGHPNYSSIPILLMDAPEAQAKAVGGATITKPFSLDALIETITRALDHRPQPPLLESDFVVRQWPLSLSTE